MSKKYCFVFHGTKEMFAEKINRFFNDTNNNESLCDNDYSMDIRQSDYAFCIKRGGHSGSYWFDPNITEKNGNLVISGQIEYLSYPYDKSKVKKFYDKIEEFSLYVFLAPLILVVKAYQLIKRLVFRIRNKPIPKEETEEDRLFFLMEVFLECTRL